MTQATERVEDQQSVQSAGMDGRVDARFELASVFEERGLAVASLSASELIDLRDLAWEHLSPVFDEILERWRDESGQLTNKDDIDRELRRRINSEKAAMLAHHGNDWECDGCSYRNHEYCAFLDFTACSSAMDARSGRTTTCATSSGH